MAQSVPFHNLTDETVAVCLTDLQSKYLSLGIAIQPTPMERRWRGDFLIYERSDFSGKVLLRPESPKLFLHAVQADAPHLTKINHVVCAINEIAHKLDLENWKDLGQVTDSDYVKLLRGVDKENSLDELYRSLHISLSSDEAATYLSDIPNFMPLRNAMPSWEGSPHQKIKYAVDVATVGPWYGLQFDALLSFLDPKEFYDNEPETLATKLAHLTPNGYRLKVPLYARSVEGILIGIAGRVSGVNIAPERPVPAFGDIETDILQICRVLAESIASQREDRLSLELANAFSAEDGILGEHLCYTLADICYPVETVSIAIDGCKTTLSSIDGGDLPASYEIQRSSGIGDGKSYHLLDRSISISIMPWRKNERNCSEQYFWHYMVKKFLNKLNCVLLDRYGGNCFTVRQDEPYLDVDSELATDTMEASQIPLFRPEVAQRAIPEFPGNQHDLLLIHIIRKALEVAESGKKSFLVTNSNVRKDFPRIIDSQNVKDLFRKIMEVEDRRSKNEQFKEMIYLGGLAKHSRMKTLIDSLRNLGINLSWDQISPHVPKLICEINLPERKDIW